MRKFFRVLGLVLALSMLSGLSEPKAIGQQKKQPTTPKAVPPHFDLDKKEKIAFSAQDRETIHKYYKSILGNLAPGSIVDRSPFPPEIEAALVPGKQIPGNYEKRLEALPKALESQLVSNTGDLVRYKLGRHIVLVKRSNLEIVDIVRDAGWKDEKK